MKDLAIEIMRGMNRVRITAGCDFDLI